MTSHPSGAPAPLIHRARCSTVIALVVVGEEPVLLPPRAGTRLPQLSSTAGWRHRMKKLALVTTLVLLATVSASAAEISTAAPATPALEQLTPGTAPLFKGIKPLVPYCSTLQGTSCPTAGATTACTDVCHNQLSCTCYNIYAPPYYVTVIGRSWGCDYEC